MTSRPIRIGTRDSALALWQARTVANTLKKAGYQPEIVPIRSQGDIDTTSPLHQLGTTGVFTKELDLALLDNRIDIAVHSLKDYPTNPPEGIVLGAHLEREDHSDVFIPHGNTDWFNNDRSEAVIATGSIRRKAQWLHRYPEHRIENLRGNVQTRLSKLETHNWQGIIMAAAGLRRMKSLPEHAIVLDWMIPAPAQGVIGVTLREGDATAGAVCAELDTEPARITSTVERRFLNILEGGCSAPIGALAQIKKGKIHFTGSLHSPDGRRAITIERKTPLEAWENAGKIWAEEVKQSGGNEILKSL